MSTKSQTKPMSKSERLALIKRRHRKLVVEPRALLASDVDVDLDDPFGEMEEAEEMNLLEAAGLGSL